jgi:multidrug efflux pump subunit AcrA (membrane-fusion protein)
MYNKKDTNKPTSTRFQRWMSVIKTAPRGAGNVVVSTLKRFPLVSFFSIFALLLILIVVGNYLRQPTLEEVAKEPTPKQVQIFQLGATPEVRVQATLEKEGVINIVAQTAGVIQSIKATEGDYVKRGAPIFNISTNYQGGNASTVARKISQRNYQFVLDTYDTQKSLISKNRDLANKGETQAAQLRQIARDSVNDTKGLISLNEDIVKGLDAQLTELEASNVGGVNDAAILQVKGVKSQTLAALNGLRSGLRNTEYLNSEEEETADMGRIARDAALQQLDIQEKSLDLNRDLAKLNVRLAQISESLSYPGTPCSGTVQRIHVKMGQVVSPGTLLATIKADDTASTAVALVPGDLVSSLSQIDASTLYFKNSTLSLVPRHIAEEPTNNGLHAVVFSLPEDINNRLPDQTTLEVGLPIRNTASTGLQTYIPLDAISFTQDQAYVYVVKQQDGKAVVEHRTVKVGEVFGQFATITEGLSDQDQVILDRSVLEGDVVSVAMAR